MWSQRKGSLRVRRQTALSALASLYASLCVRAVLCTATSEEHALRQALTIVQLLRSEFSRPVPNLTIAPAPTCAPTTAVLSTRFDPSRRHWSAWYDEAALRRRMDYEDGFGAHPSSSAIPKSLTSPPSIVTTKRTSNYSQNNLDQNVTTPPTSIPTQSLSTSTKKTVSPFLTLSSSISISSQYDPSSESTIHLATTSFENSAITPSIPVTKLLLEYRPETLVKSSIKFVTSISPKNVVSFMTSRASIPTKTVTRIPKKLVGLMKDHVLETLAPELEQVAAELVEELESSGVTRPARLKGQRTSKRPTVRASWREYLARSTRYAVPLPENHAFCYTDPHNALCRTFI